MLPKIKKIMLLKIDKSWWRKLAIGLVVLAAFITVSNEVYYWLGDDYVAEESSDANVADGECNVLGIELHGDIYTYLSPENKDADGAPIVDEVDSESIVAVIRNADKDETVKAILLEVDSYGGLPVAGEEVAQALKKAQKPTVALIRSSGTSAAYWAATGADVIFASKNSDVGGIGVTMSYLDNVEQNKNEGLNYNSLSAGKYKDYGDPDRQLTAEEKKLLQRDLNIIHQNFISDVATNRNLDVKTVAKLADGSTMLGEMALDNKLIDKIGGFNEVIDYIKELTGVQPEICWQ